MTLEAARSAAKRRLGNVTRIKEQSYEAIGFRIECRLQDCRFAIRQLVRSSGFTAAVIGTLSLGIGATTSIFTLVNATLLRSLPYPNARFCPVFGVKPLLGRVFDEREEQKKYAGSSRPGLQRLAKNIRGETQVSSAVE